MFTTKARSFWKRRNKKLLPPHYEDDPGTALVLPGICSLADIFPKNRVAKATNKNNRIEVFISHKIKKIIINNNSI